MRTDGAYGYPVLGDRPARSDMWEGPSAAAINHPWNTDSHVVEAKRAEERRLTTEAKVRAQDMERAARIAADAVEHGRNAFDFHPAVDVRLRYVADPYAGTVEILEVAGGDVVADDHPDAVRAASDAPALGGVMLRQA